MTELKYNLYSKNDGKYYATEYETQSEGVIMAYPSSQKTFTLDKGDKVKGVFCSVWFYPSIDLIEFDYNPIEGD